MTKIYSLSLVVLVGFVWATSHLLAAEKFRYSTAVKGSVNYELPYYAALEKGYWKEQGLEAEYIPFRGGMAQMTAVVAHEINMGLDMAPVVFLAAARGVPVLVVAELVPKSEFYLWARTGGRFQEIKDLKKGAKVGIHAFGSTMEAYVRVITETQGVEKEVKIVAAGGVREAVAALKAGIVDMIMFSIFQTVKMVAAGEAFPLVKVSPYLPEEWLDFVIFARKDFVKTDTAKRAVKAILQAISFIRENPGWARKKMKELQGLTDKEVEIIMTWHGLPYTKDGKIRRQAIENVRNFLLKYKLLPRDKTPPVEELYSTELTG